jgi:hypothetical protein
VRRSLFRHTLLGACLSAPFLLVGCGGDEGVPQNFPPLRYTYLAPISLNVSSIATQVAYAPTEDGTSLDAMSPEAPIQAVEQMLQDRLVAGGSGGTATVTINSASLNRVNDTVVGNISVQVTVTSADGRQSGYTQASVTRTRTTPDDTSDDAMRAFLYSMTSDLVNAENVELEYQIRQHLAAWLVGGTSPIVGGPAAPAPVEAEPLGGPGAPAVGMPATGMPATGMPATGMPATGAPMPLTAPTPLGAPAPAAMPTPYPAPYPTPTPYAEPAVPPVTQPMPMGAPSAVPGSDGTPTMPSSDLGLPQGNPLPQDVTPPPPAIAAPTGAPAPAYQLVPATPPAANSGVPMAQPTPVPAPVPPPAPAPANPGALPPLPSTITP